MCERMPFSPIYWMDASMGFREFVRTTLNETSLNRTVSDLSTDYWHKCHTTLAKGKNENISVRLMMWCAKKGHRINKWSGSNKCQRKIKLNDIFMFWRSTGAQFLLICRNCFTKLILRNRKSSLRLTEVGKMRPKKREIAAIENRNNRNFVRFEAIFWPHDPTSAGAPFVHVLLLLHIHTYIHSDSARFYGKVCVCVHSSDKYNKYIGETANETTKHLMPSYHPKRSENTCITLFCVKAVIWLCACVRYGGWKSRKIKSLNTWERQNDKMINYSICSVRYLYICMLGIRWVFPFFRCIPFSIRLLLLVLYKAARLPWIHQTLPWSRFYFQSDWDRKRKRKSVSENWTNKWKFEREWKRARKKVRKKMKYSAQNTRKYTQILSVLLKWSLPKVWEVYRKWNSRAILYSSHMLSMPWRSRNNFFVYGCIHRETSEHFTLCCMNKCSPPGFGRNELLEISVLSSVRFFPSFFRTGGMRFISLFFFQY